MSLGGANVDSLSAFCEVFVSNFGPRFVINMAPNGAVIKMLKTAIDTI